MFRIRHLKFIIVPFLLVFSCTILDPGEPGNLVPPTVDDDPDLSSLRINDTKLYVETFGDPVDDIIIFLHGGPGLDFRYLTRLDTLQDSYFCVFWDQRSTGLSRRHDKEEITIDLYIEDLHQLIDHYQESANQQVYLVGHSWGGMYAAAYISEHPDNVDKAILIASGPFTSDEWPLSYPPLSDPRLHTVLWNSQFMTVGTSHEKLDYMFKTIMPELLPRTYNCSKYDPVPSVRGGGMCNAVLLADKNGYLDFDFTDGLDSFTRPVLFISGSDDNVFGREFQKKQMDFFSNYQSVEIDSAGHDIGWIQHEKVASKIRQFIRQ
ncbi:MAG: alpha/beta fold hydrolase [Chitinivibrionales bacterium]|nr:alpha/beta fold hydrolase [Chitinivibrionales bacterium]